MKRIIPLIVLLACLLSAFAYAEEIESARDIAFDIPTSETATVWQDADGTNTHTLSVIGQLEGSAARLTVTLVYSGNTTWESVDSFIKPILSDVLSDSSLSSAREIADSASRRIETERSLDAYGEDDVLPIWLDSSLVVECVTAEYPYTPDLAEGASGKAVALLQERLQVLGYYTGVCDGNYGEETAASVKTVQKLMRDTESAQISALSEPSEADEEDIVPDVEMTDLGERPLAEPKTQLTGIADARFQAFLYSEQFPVYGETLSYGSEGNDVTRLQNRLYLLGCAFSASDGVYGGDTQRAVMIYQYYNNMEQTGIADEAVLSSIFSENAVAPENPILQKGSSGESVKTLQQRLNILGFMTGSVDGDYGSATEEGVKNLQKYIRQMEMNELYAQSHETIAPGPVEDEDDIVLFTESGHVATEDEVDMSLVKTQVNGIADPILLDTFYAATFPVVPDMLKEGSSGNDVLRLQRRLQGLSYLYSEPDGDYGSATASAVKDFQKRHNLSQDGIAGAETLSLLFSESAKVALKPYEIKVSTKDQRVYVYAPDSNDQYTILVKTMKCSTGASGTPTPKGTYQSSTCRGARWHYFKKFDCWAQYAYYIQGDIMFHSVLYSKKNGPVTQSSVNNLGHRASHGCVRLSVEDAKWIWTNCPNHTKVTVY